MSKTDVILSFEKVSGKQRKFNLQDISMELMPGFIYGLVGENGAGKTTLMRYIMDEKIKYAGRICVAGEDIRLGHAAAKSRIGYVSEDNHFFGKCTGKQNAEILGVFYDNFDMDKFMDEMNRMELSPSKIYEKMSRGEQLKFQLAFAIAHTPCLYLLDEMTAGMDPVFTVDFFEMLQRLILDETCAVLMTSHITSEIERKTDYVGVMKKGRLVTFGESLSVMPQLGLQFTHQPD